MRREITTERMDHIARFSHRVQTLVDSKNACALLGKPNRNRPAVAPSWPHAARASHDDHFIFKSKFWDKHVGVLFGYWMLKSHSGTCLPTCHRNIHTLTGNVLRQA